MKKIHLGIVSIKNLKNLKQDIFLPKQFFVLFVITVVVMMKKYLRKKNRLRY